MDIRISNNNQFYCIFSAKEIFWHDFKKNIHILFPYGSIDKIYFSFGILTLKSQNKVYKARLKQYDKNIINDAIVFAKNLSKISVSDNPMQLPAPDPEIL